jgi:Tat protein translocase TatB subunit
MIICRACSWRFLGAVRDHRSWQDGGHGVNLFEIILILAVALVVLGPEKLPEVMRVVGKVLRELRLASNTVVHELTDALDEESNKTRPSAPVARESSPPSSPVDKT